MLKKCMENVEPNSGKTLPKVRRELFFFFFFLIFENRWQGFKGKTWSTPRSHLLFTLSVGRHGTNERLSPEHDPYPGLSKINGVLQTRYPHKHPSNQN